MCVISAPSRRSNPTRSACCRRSMPGSMTTAHDVSVPVSRHSKRSELRKRWLRASFERQTSQRQPTRGTPLDAPVPRSVSRSKGSKARAEEEVASNAREEEEQSGGRHSKASSAREEEDAAGARRTAASRPYASDKLAISPQIGTDGGMVRRVARACCHWRRRAGCACFGVVFSRLCEVCLNRVLTAAANFKSASLIVSS